MQDDYFERVTEGLAAALASLLGRGGAAHDVEQHRDAARRWVTGLGPGLIATMAPLSLIALLNDGGGVPPDRAFAVAEALLEEAQAADPDLAALPDGVALTSHALGLVDDALLQTSPLPAGARAVARWAVERADAYGPPDPDLPPSFRVWDHLGAYATAEDRLFRWLGTGDGDALPAGRGFYARLLSLEDEALILGGLPRDEVLDGQAELARYA